VSGITGDHVLFSNIAIEDYLIPVLHLVLGLGGEVAGRWRIFIRLHVEDSMPEVKALDKLILAQTNEIEDLQEEKDMYILMEEGEVSKGSARIAQYNNVVLSKAYLKLRDRRDDTTGTARPLTAVMRADLASFEQKLAEVQEYAPGSIACRDALDLQEEYTENLEKLDEAIKVATASEEAHKLKIKELAGDMKWREVEHAWEDILKGYSIVYQQFYTSSLVGEHLHRLCENYEEVCDKTGALFIKAVEDRAALTREQKDALRVQIDAFTIQQKELLSMLDYLTSIMRSMDEVLPEERTRFREVATLFGERYRLYLGKKLTVKGHYLESHVADALDRWEGRMGLGNEDPVEKLHHNHNVFERRYQCVRNWTQRQHLIDRSVAVSEIPAIVEAQNHVRAATKREFGAVSVDKKEVKEEQRKELKKARGVKVGALVEANQVKGADNADTHMDTT
jgi:hypothetical protein